MSKTWRIDFDWVNQSGSSSCQYEYKASAEEDYALFLEAKHIKNVRLVEITEEDISGLYGKREK